MHIRVKFDLTRNFCVSSFLTQGRFRDPSVKYIFYIFFYFILFPDLYIFLFFWEMCVSSPTLIQVGILSGFDHFDPNHFSSSLSPVLGFENRGAVNGLRVRWPGRAKGETADARSFAQCAADGLGRGTR